MATEDDRLNEASFDRRESDQRADDIETRADVDRGLIDLLAVGIVVLLLFVGWFTFQASRTATKANSTSSDIQALETKNRDTNRETAFRLCTRNKVDRAFAHASIRGIPIKGIQRGQTRSPGERRALEAVSDQLMIGPLLPILDCDPNLRGKGAHPLPLSEQIKFVKRWARGDLTLPEAGICPNSVIGQAAPPSRC